MSIITLLRPIVRVAAIAGSIAATPAPNAVAGTFHVNPIRIYLSPRNSSALLTVKNDSADRVRFQVTAVAWDQSADGEMIFKPTVDLIFYPNLLTAGAGEERKIRIGSNGDFGNTEKSYRIFIEELPPDEIKQQNGVRILTKMGIPVFLQTVKPQAIGKLDSFNLDNGRFSFVLRNTGNVHFFPRNIAVRGKTARGEVVVDGQLQPWYVLAGGIRQYSVPIPRRDCVLIRDIAVEIQLDEKTLAETVPMPGNFCRG